MRKSVLLLIALVVLAASCGTSQKVLYFQNSQDGQGIALPEAKDITICPKDKISIIVKSRDYNLSNLFNLPYFTQRVGTSVEAVSSNGYTQGIAGYLVDDSGCIDFPVLGTIKVEGMTRGQLQQYLRNRLISEDLVKDPTIVVDFMNLRISVMGEVNAPGRYAIDHDQFTVLDAISAAGDLTIYGNRNNIKVLRTEDGKKFTYNVDISSLDSLAVSNAYYLKQNDVVYVEPNRVRSRQSTVNGNNILSASFWISVASLVSNIALYFINANR